MLLLALLSSRTGDELIASSREEREAFTRAWPRYSPLLGFPAFSLPSSCWLLPALHPCSERLTHMSAKPPPPRCYGILEGHWGALSCPPKAHRSVCPVSTVQRFLGRVLRWPLCRDELRRFGPATGSESVAFSLRHRLACTLEMRREV